MVPDYYAMLGVDPNADRAAIEGALARKQPAWSSGTRNPKTKHTFQSYLDQIPAIRQTLLGDPATRRAYDAEREAGLRAERDRKLDALQKRLRLRAAKGGLTVSDRKLLREEAVKLGLTAADLDRLAEPIPPLPDEPEATDAPEIPVDVLDPVMRRQLRVALDHLGKRDLYDALGLARDAPVRELTERADAERQRWMKKTQVTAEKTAWLEVVTLAQSHLTTPASRARYDRTLVLETEEEFSASIRFALQGLGLLDPGTRSALLDEASAAGITAERADRLIQRACRTLGVARDGAGGPVPSAGTNGAHRILRCRSCGGGNEFSRLSKLTGGAFCRHCRAPLRWTCPTCRRTHWADEPRCRCGFKVAWYEPFVRHFEAAQRAFRNREYEPAMVHLRRAQEYSPEHVGSRKGVEKVRERLAEIQRVRTSCEQAIGARRLVEARAAAEEWGRLVPPGSSEWEAAANEIARGLREASALAARAREGERRDPKAARDLYRKSLSIVADLPEALTGLHRCPPDPPSDLTAVFEDDHVRLSWSPPRPDGLGPVSFVVLRKSDSALAHPADGVRIGQTTLPEFLDRDVLPGTSVAYAVLSRRGEIESLGAVAVGPIYLMGEVREVLIEVRAREVDLTWLPPRGVSEIRVVRKHGGPPTGPLDGDRVESLIDRAHDRGLVTDRVYHYGIYAIYRTAEGKATASRGVVVAAQPQTPVAVIEAPVVQLDGDGAVRIGWVEPSRGLVRLLRTSRPVPHPPGTRLSPTLVAALEGEWVAVTSPDHARDQRPRSGYCFYTPFCSWGGTLTAGHPAVFTSVPDPADLRASRAGGRVQLRWVWSPQGSQTLVVARAGAPPTGPDDPSAVVETVHEADYTRFGQYSPNLPDGAAGPWHVAVYALAFVDGEPVCSPGFEPSARTVIPGLNAEVVLSYQFRPKGWPRRRWSVTFQTRPAGSPVPATLLVTHPRTTPYSAEDGDVSAQFPPSSDGSTFELPQGIDPRKTHARVFADPRTEFETSPPLRVVHPGDDPARV